MRTPQANGSGRWMAAAIALAAAWWLLDLAGLRAGAPDRLDDTWEYGVVARALLEGQGFRTPVIHPPLWGLRDAAFTVPVLVHGPLVPVLLAPVLALFGPGALDGIAWLAALGALAAVPSLVRLGVRCGGPPVGFAAALLWTVAPLTLRSVHHDVALTLGAALLAAALELATRPAAERGPRPLAAGVALGLACLARHELLAALPLFALALGSRGWRLLAGAGLCLAPWWIHHALAVGQPLFNLSSYLAIGYWGDRPGISVLRDFALTPDRFGAEFAARLPALPAKWADFAPHAAKRALLAPFGAVGWLAALGLGFGLAARATRRNAWLFGAIAMIPVAVMTVTLYDDRYLVPFLPLYALAAASGARALAQRLPWWMHRPRAWIGALALVAIPAAGPALRDEASRSARDRAILASERAALAKWDRAIEAEGAWEPGPAARLVFSDTPDFVAWTTGRPVVWIAPEDLPRLPAEPGPGGLPARPEGRRVWLHPGDSDVSR